MHHNSQKRIIEKDKIYAITTVTHERFPYFGNKILAWLFIAQLKLTKILKGFRLYAFCVLFDHVHLLIEPKDKTENIARIMQLLKRNFTRNANIVLGYDDNLDANEYIDRLNEGDNYNCRLPGVNEKTLLNKMGVYILRLKRKHFQSNYQLPPFKWQSSYHDHIIRNDRDFYAHYEYIAQNYQKHSDDTVKNYKYPEKYQFTSFNFENMIDNVFE